MQVEILSVFEVSDNFDLDVIKQVLSSCVDNELKRIFDGKYDGIEHVLSTTYFSGQLENSVRCSVDKVDDGPYIVRGDEELGKDLVAKIGPEAKRFN